MTQNPWHNCDGEIGYQLRYVVGKKEDIGNTGPTWFIMVDGKPKMIDTCPVCGDELTLLHLVDWKPGKKETVDA